MRFLPSSILLPLASLASFSSPVSAQGPGWTGIEVYYYTGPNCTGTEGGSAVWGCQLRDVQSAIVKAGEVFAHYNTNCMDDEPARFAVEDGCFSAEGYRAWDALPLEDEN
ncbi:hypothetical protein UCREL1_4889 [Eutypa lata UCREL1]|uniref:Uncharacterized protein n=1 Tax=Eutypa lata (strain UCR-EL1) TaxID=1287681 RepID=M7TDW8_EUTLA|nr:hypothetical protein UCREL1_4889 [Eutypa lata UCREL1]